MKAVIYTRVSTNEQSISGLGLEAQLESCRRHCELRWLDVIGTYSDPGVSGRSEPVSRMGFAGALRALGGDGEVALVVSALSRLTRRQAVLWRYLDEAGPYKLKLQSASEPFDTSTSMGRAMVGMLGVWAQLEADMISERTKAALAARKARGLRVGNMGLIEKLPEVVELIGRMHDRDRLGYTAIAKELTRIGAPSYRPGGRWHPTAVRRAVLQYRAKAQTVDVDRERVGGDGPIAVEPAPIEEPLEAGLESLEIV